MQYKLSVVFPCVFFRKYINNYHIIEEESDIILVVCVSAMICCISCYLYITFGFCTLVTFVLFSSLYYPCS